MTSYEREGNGILSQKLRFCAFWPWLKEFTKEYIGLWRCAFGGVGKGVVVAYFPRIVYLLKCKMCVCVYVHKTHRFVFLLLGVIYFLRLLCIASLK